MPKQIFKKGTVKVAGVDLSDHVESIAFDAQTPQIDVTSLNATARQYLAGFRDDSVDINFYSDDDAASVIATLYGQFSGGSIFAFSVSAYQTPFSATAPIYNGSAVITDFPIINGKVGDALMSAVKFKPYGALVPGTA